MSRGFDSLRTSADFAQLSKGGIRHNARFFSVVVYKRPEPSPFNTLRLGIVASKRSYKLAVDRNRAKRRIRSMIQKFSIDYNLSGFDILVIARRGFVECEYSKLDHAMRKIISRI